MGDTEEKFDFAVTAPKRFNAGDYKNRTEVLRNLGSNLKKALIYTKKTAMKHRSFLLCEAGGIRTPDLLRDRETR